MYESTVKSKSPEQTIALGEALGQSFDGGEVLGLIGCLGAGKTHFVKGIAVGNGLESARTVTSPTFNLVHQYPGRLNLNHVDAYRLAGVSDLASIGFDDLMRSDAVVVVEWADKIREALPSDALWIELSVDGPAQRTITFKASGRASERCLRVFRHAVR